MGMTVKVAPSILSADFGRLADQVAEAEEAGADWIHVDVMDGRFVPNITIGPLVAAAVRRATTLPVDVHLMIEAPERYVGAFVDAGADWVTVHQEACPHLHRTVEQIRSLGARAGVALNPATPVQTMREIAPWVDLLLIMSVNPGFGGQRYIPTSTDKVRRAAEMLRTLDRQDVELEVDGGIDATTAAALARAGATVLVAGSSVFGHAAGVAGGIGAIRDACNEAKVTHE